MQFHFVGMVERDGRLPIRITPRELDQVRDEADQIIAENFETCDLDEICIMLIMARHVDSGWSVTASSVNGSITNKRLDVGTVSLYHIG